jgi:hypothetical protein
MLTDRGTEFCGTQSHEYELYLAVEDIDHSRTKTKSPQTTDVIDKQFLCSAEASRFSVPACHFGWRRAQGWSRLAGAHRCRRLGLDHPERGVTLGCRRASLLANLRSRTDDRVAKSRAPGESPAAQPDYCRSSFAAPVRAFGPLAFQPATKRA